MDKSVPLGTEKISPHADSTPAAVSEPVPCETGDLEEKVVAALRTCYDPEIPVNIFELGLIYQVNIDASGAVNIRMTLTSPACPVAGVLPGEVQSKVQAIPGVQKANVELVWDPPWNQDMMSEAAKLELGMF